MNAIPAVVSFMRREVCSLGLESFKRQWKYRHVTENCLHFLELHDLYMRLYNTIYFDKMALARADPRHDERVRSYFRDRVEKNVHLAGY
jgi:hypothetical protein